MEEMFSFNSRHQIRNRLRLSYTCFVIVCVALDMKVPKGRITKKYYLHFRSDGDFEQKLNSPGKTLRYHDARCGSTRCVPVNSAGSVQWGGAALYRVYRVYTLYSQQAQSVSQTLTVMFLLLSG